MKKNAYIEMFAVEDTHWWYVGLHNLVTLLIDSLFQKQKLKILDVGCGTGGLLSILKQAGHEVKGLDFSDEAISHCHKRGLNNVFKADINTWDPIQNSYDLITAFDVLSHEWINDEIQVFRSLSNGLKDDGLIMLNYPAFSILSRQHDKVAMMRRRYTKKMITEILREANLSPTIISYRLPHAFFIILLLRLFEPNKSIEHEAKSDIAKIPIKLVNQLLIGITKIENYFISSGFSIPLGSSLFVVAKKRLSKTI